MIQFQHQLLYPTVKTAAIDDLAQKFRVYNFAKEGEEYWKENVPIPLERSIGEKAPDLEASSRTEWPDPQ